MKNLKLNNIFSSFGIRAESYSALVNPINSVQHYISGMSRLYFKIISGLQSRTNFWINFQTYEIGCPLTVLMMQQGQWKKHIVYISLPCNTQLWTTRNGCILNDCSFRKYSWKWSFNCSLFGRERILIEHDLPCQLNKNQHIVQFSFHKLAKYGSWEFHFCCIV